MKRNNQIWWLLFIWFCSSVNFSQFNFNVEQQKKWKMQTKFTTEHISFWIWIYSMWHVWATNKNIKFIFKLLFGMKNHFWFLLIHSPFKWKIFFCRMNYESMHMISPMLSISIPRHRMCKKGFFRCWSFFSKCKHFSHSAKSVFCSSGCESIELHIREMGLVYHIRVEQKSELVKDATNENE